MKSVFAGIFLLAGVVPVMAQQPVVEQPPDYVPFVVDKANFDAIRRYLGGLKFDDAAPIVDWLETQRQKARAQWAADNLKKPDEVPK